MTTAPRSIKLAPENWQVLAELAKAEGLTVNGYIAQVLGEKAKAQGKNWKTLRQWGGRRVKSED